MKTKFNKLLRFLKNPAYQKIIMIIIIFIFGVLLFKDCGRTIDDDKVTKLEQNIAYYKDSLRTVKNLAEEVEYQRDILAAENKNLKELNSSLYREVKKQKDQVIYISNINAVLSSEIIELKKELEDSIEYYVYPDGTQSISWKHDTIYSDGNSKYIWGSTKFRFLDDEQLIDERSISVSLRDSLNFSLTTGLQEDKETGLLNIFVRSKYPGFNVTSIDGAIIDPQESKLIKAYFPEEKFGFGFTLGYGVSVNDGVVRLSPAVIFGLTYNITTFNPRTIFRR